MRYLKLTLAYDGAEYVGWQVQTNGPSVQAALELAWQEVTGETIRVTASGRTDSGVHALGQVVSLATQSKLGCLTILRALNARLPEDVVVLNVEEARDGFNAINDAVRKRYRYVIHDGRLRDPLLRSYAWHIFRPLDEAAMQRAANRLVGRHDFACFQSAGSPRASTVRTITDLTVRREAVWPLFYSSQAKGIDLPHGHDGQDQPPAASGLADKPPLERSQTRLIIEVEADGFLYNMVRNIVGTLVLVGRGDHAETWVDELIQSRDRTLAGPTAPAQGLFLVRVDYA